MRSEQPEARVEGLSAEDRARLDHLAGHLAHWGSWATSSRQMAESGESLTRALALIDQQAKALEAADDLVDGLVRSGVDPSLPLRPLVAAYRSTRTTERTTDG